MSQNPNDIKALTAEWYKKLKKSGFEDLEDHTNGMLKKWHSYYFKARYSPEQFSAKETYFREACKFLYEYPFKNRVDSMIWRHHANGRTLVEIEKLLKSTTTPLKIDAIRNVLSKVRKAMEAALSGRHND